MFAHLAHAEPLGTVAAFPSYEAETRRAGPDGWFWPFTREAMRSPEAIEERMALDLSGLIARLGSDAVITTEHYLRLGWTRRQVERHGLEATRRLAAVREARARDNANEVA